MNGEKEQSKGKLLNNSKKVKEIPRKWLNWKVQEWVAGRAGDKGTEGKVASARWVMITAWENNKKLYKKDSNNLSTCKTTCLQALFHIKKEQATRVKDATDWWGSLWLLFRSIGQADQMSDQSLEIKFIYAANTSGSSTFYQAPLRSQAELKKRRKACAAHQSVHNCIPRYSSLFSYERWNLIYKTTSWYIKQDLSIKK